MWNESEYIRGEEREGYYVQPMMKRIWAVQLDLLREIDMVCKRHGIKYYGWFGTLLGAVRHQGFIPWDDDLDLAMLREDYERFRYYAKTELPKGREISEREPTLVSVFNTDVVRLDQEFLDKSHGCPLKTGIDIFCLDRIPPGDEDEQIQLNLFWSVYGLCLNWDMPEEDEKWEGLNKWECLGEVEELTGYSFERQRPVKEQLYFLGDRIAAMYWDMEYDHVTNVAWLYNHDHYRIPKDCFDNIIEVPFENTTIPVLKDYDLICRLTYGEAYMTPVKEYKHDYLKKQIDQLREYFQERGLNLPECFEMTFETDNKDETESDSQKER